MQKTSAQADGCPRSERSETERYEGVQTSIWICEDNVVEVPFGKYIEWHPKKEPPYAERHVRWCERTESEIGEKLFHFPPTRFAVNVDGFQ